MKTCHIETMNPECKTEALNRLLQITGPQDTRISPRWVPDLPRVFAGAGMVNTQSDLREMPPALAYQSHECNLMTFESLARRFQNPEYAKAVGDLIPEVMAESRKGAWLAFTRWTVVGKKVDNAGS